MDFGPGPNLRAHRVDMLPVPSVHVCACMCLRRFSLISGPLHPAHFWSVFGKAERTGAQHFPRRSLYILVILVWGRLEKQSELRGNPCFHLLWH